MKGLDATQIEQLKQIAEYLCYQRQEKGVSLEKVAKDTFIPLRLLEALDTMQVEQLPEPVYIRGFIRRYADALGLEGVEIANAFPLEAAPVIETVVRSAPEVSSEPPVIRRSHAYDSELSESSGMPSRRSNLPLIVSGVAAVVVVGAIALGALSLFKKSPTDPAIAPETTSQENTSGESSREKNSESTTAQSNDSKSDPEKLNPSSTLSPSSEENTSPTTGEKPGEKPTSSASDGASKSVQLEINLTGSSWIQVIADGKSEFEGTLKKGDQRSWSAEKDIVITAGEAGAVTASCNQSEAKPLGKPGEVIDSTCSTNKEQAGGESSQ